VTGVTFGGVAALFTFNSDGSITATVPAATASGAVDVQVTMPAGTSATSSADHFTYTASSAPSVTGLSVTSGGTAGGMVLTIGGSGFLGATSVSFGGVSASVTVNSDSSITATVPVVSSAGVVDVVVTTAAGASATSSADQFTYTPSSAPAVTGLSVTSGVTAGGTVLSISGNGFTGVIGVTVGGIAARFTFNSDGSITAIVPAATATGVMDVQVTTAAGTSPTGSADQFTYTASPSPVVSGLSVTSGAMTGGTTLTISGSGFTGALGVLVGGVPTFFTLNSDGSITAIVPPSLTAAGVVDVQVMTEVGTSATCSADQFTYTA